MQGGTAQIDERRFRPNIYIDSFSATNGFVEDDWLGHRLQLGADLVCTDFNRPSGASPRRSHRKIYRATSAS